MDEEEKAITQPFIIIVVSTFHKPNPIVVFSFIIKYRIFIGIAYLALGYIRPSLCFLLLGLIFLYFGITTIFQLWKLYRSGVECNAKIVSYETDDEGYKTPVMEFNTADGKSITEKPWVYGSSDLSKIRTYSEKLNEPTKVIYNSDHPEEFVLKSEFGFNFFILILLIAGGIFATGFAISALFGFVPGFK